MMKLRHTWLLASSLLATVDAQSSGLTQRYCSSQNTASNLVGVVNDYQSNGACKTQCQGSYAFAIVQGNLCWCSNFAPASTVSTSNCNLKCPGYPDDLCGSPSSGLFGYIALGPAASGTVSNQQQAVASQTTTSASSSSTIPSSSEPQSSPSTDQSVDTTTVISTVTLGSNSGSTSSPDPSTAAVTSVQVITVSGAVVYKTVTSTPTPASGLEANVQRTSSSGLSGGAIAGIVIGVLAGLAAILLGLFLLWRRRRARQEEDAAATEKTGRSPKRNISVLSRSGLLGGVAAAETSNEKDFDEPIHPGTSSQRHSLLFGGAANAEGVSPISPLETTHSGDSRRHSKPMVYDQRLNPSALFATHDNGSRASMQDGADYSRTLGVTNPDPRSSFESRISRA